MFITGHLLRLCLPKATKATSLNLAVQPTLSSQPSISSSQRLEMSFEERSHELRAPLVASPLEELESLLMKMKEESEKAGLNLNTQKTKITASSPMTSWQIDGETLETVRDFIFLASKITADGDCSHEIKRYLLLGRKAMTNLDSLLKSRGITLSAKARLVKAMIFPVVMYGCESWTIKKVGTEELMLLNCSVGEDS